MWGLRRSPRPPRLCEPKHRLLRLTEGTHAVSKLFNLSTRSLERNRDANWRRTSSTFEGATHSNNRPTCCLARSGSDAGKVQQWENDFDPTRPIVVACKAGHEMSQTTVAQLRADGIDARVLEGGYEGWTKAGLPFVAKTELERIAPQRPSVWVTRRRPKIDRIACPWLIRRFLDPQARILFVDPDQVNNVAREIGGVPFDIKDVELSHVGERCSFDTMLQVVRVGGRTLADAAGADRERCRYGAT